MVGVSRSPTLIPFDASAQPTGCSHLLQGLAPDDEALGAGAAVMQLVQSGLSILRVDDLSLGGDLVSVAEVEHLLGQGATSDERALHARAVEDHGEAGHWIRLGDGANEHQHTGVRLQGADDAVDLVMHGDSVKNAIECAAERADDCFVGHHGEVCSQGCRFCFLGIAAAEHGDLGTHGLGDLHRHHAEAAEAHDTHCHVFLPHDVPSQGRVCGDAGTAQRPGRLKRHALGHLEDEALVHRDVRRVAAVRPRVRTVIVVAVLGEHAAVGLAHLRAVLLEALLAEVALHAAVHHAAHGNLFPDLETARSLVSNCTDHTSDLMAWGDGVLADGPIAVDAVQVGVAHAAEDDIDGHVVGAGGGPPDLHLAHLVLGVMCREHEAALAADDGRHGLTTNEA
mmetsp:Transcript_94601/g.240650  ORF Transcript_94601/g.240650 Transcript_94601/m.240650 type:complete len:396 (-) Transcript_94601:52-1239(-)